MSQPLTDSRIANLGARAIHQAFTDYMAAFGEITARAKGHFETRNWKAMQADSGDRLDIYRKIVDQCTKAVHDFLGDRVEEQALWMSIKAVYSGIIAGQDEWELAETYFNSITRRIFTTVGVDPKIEFVDTDFETPPNQPRSPVYKTYERAESTRKLIETILDDFSLDAYWDNPKADTEIAADQISRKLKAIGALRVVDRAELAGSIFFRGKAAYLIGRIFSGSHRIPFVITLLNEDRGVFIHAVLTEETDVSILLSFTHSYFHVVTDRPYDLVRFLSLIVPRKRVAEIYISIGHNKQGKTELFRDLLGYIETSDDRFEFARGTEGMVMIVFTLPGYDMVFKLIRDHFARPKKSTRDDVRESYRLVFRIDRAGRLVDAQEFEFLQFHRDRFNEDLLNTLLAEASETVSLQGELVVIRHAYMERRVIPLNIFVKEAEERAVLEAAIDYGNAIKDLAATNIFAGDFLLKNFGVTRHGRVVFYDYDELCPLVNCNFRTMPPSRNDDDEFSAEPWYRVDPEDIFPEEFETFLELTGEARAAFLQYHSDLFQPDFWKSFQIRHLAGEVIHFFPYPPGKRLRNPRPGSERVWSARYV